MTPELNKNEGLPDGAEPDATRRINAGSVEQPEATEPQETRTTFGSLREAYLRARDGRKRVQPEKQSRTAKSIDRSKGLLVLAVAVIIMIFVFLGMFSSSSGTKDRAANRTKPSLGRPDITAGTAENRGSVTPLLNADMSGQDAQQRSAQRRRRKGHRAVARASAAEIRRYPRQYPSHGSGSGGVSASESRQPCSAASARGRERPAPYATASAGS